MKYNIKKIKEYYKVCDICKKIIKGSSKKQVLYNLDIHKKSHKEKTK